MAFVKKNFERLNDSDLDTRGNAVVNGMTGNVNFPDPGEVLTILTTAYNAYSLALAVGKGGTAAQIAEKNNRRGELVDALKAMADYVNYVSGGDRSMLLITVYELNKEGRTPVVAEPLKSFSVTYGANSGSIDLNAKKGNEANKVLCDYSVEEPKASTI